MDKIFFSDWQSLIRIVIISVFAYIALLVILRISGKRTLSKMNAYDLIVTVAIGSTLSSVIITKNVTLSEGILAFALLVLWQYVVTYLSVRNKEICNLVKSSPTLLVFKGELLEMNMKKERITPDEIYEALRKKGAASLKEADAVVLETDGNISVLKHVVDINNQVFSTVQKNK